MSNDLNLAQFIGRLGKDPESRSMPSGQAVTNFRIACGSSWKDKDTGEKKEQTEWVSIVAFGKLAEICAQYLTKGSQVYCQGRLKTRKWQDKEGKDRYTTEVVLDQMQMLGGKRDATSGDQARRTEPAAAPAGEKSFEDDDIPF